ncbi:MAG: hypothetical protein ACREDP_24395, partial [Bradyrhizobium sp.]
MSRDPAPEAANVNRRNTLTKDADYSAMSAPIRLLCENWQRIVDTRNALDAAGTPPTNEEDEGYY